MEKGEYQAWVAHLDAHPDEKAKVLEAMEREDPTRPSTETRSTVLKAAAPARSKSAVPERTNDKARSRITVVGQDEWLASPEGQRFQAMSEQEREAYRSDLFMAPAMEPFRRFLADWVVKIRRQESREREAAAMLTTTCCGGAFVEVDDRPRDPLDSPTLIAELWSRDHLVFECSSCQKTADVKAAADAWLAASSRRPVQP
jgi:hypothetical protein